jgi:hypothetical protein
MLNRKKGKLAVAWDEKTVQHFGKATAFNVKITCITKRFGFGASSDTLAFPSVHQPLEPTVYEISGIVMGPKYVLANLTFDTRQNKNNDFGGWGYNLYNPTNGPEALCLDFSVYDRENKIAEALYESHRSALASGERASSVRFFKREGDGAMSVGEIADGRFLVDGGGYPLLGMLVWSVYQSNRLPRWAMPFADREYSTEDLPRSSWDLYDVLRKPPKASTKLFGKRLDGGGWLDRPITSRGAMVKACLGLTIAAFILGSHVGMGMLMTIVFGFFIFLGVTGTVAYLAETHTDNE